MNDSQKLDALRRGRVTVNNRYWLPFSEGERLMIREWLAGTKAVRDSEIKSILAKKVG